MATTILRYEPRNGPPQWVLCIDGRVVSIRERLVDIEADLENPPHRRQDPDGSGA